MKSIKLLAVALGLVAASALQAGSIKYNAADDGTTAPAGATFSTTGGSIVEDTRNGVTYIGNDGGNLPEIEYGETLSVTFDEAQVVTSLTLGLLFNGPEYADVNETATINVGGDVYTLALTGENTAWFSGPSGAWAVAGGPTVNGQAGLFTIENPFAGAVWGFELTSLIANANGLSGSDFGLVAFSTPDASSTIALMGLALLGMAGFARRARRA